MQRLCQARRPPQASRLGARGSAKGLAPQQHRFVHVHACQGWGKEYTGLAIARYCSKACRQRAKRRRARAGAQGGPAPSIG